MRIPRKHFSRFEPPNRQRQVGLGVLTPPRPSRVSSMPGGGVRTPSPTFRFVVRRAVSRAVWKLPSPRPSPHSFVVGRGSSRPLLVPPRCAILQALLIVAFDIVAARPLELYTDDPVWHKAIFANAEVRASTEFGAGNG